MKNKNLINRLSLRNEWTFLACCPIKITFATFPWARNTPLETTAPTIQNNYKQPEKMTVSCYHPICSQIQRKMSNNTGAYSPKACDATRWMFWQLSIQPYDVGRPTAHQPLTYFVNWCVAGQKAVCQPGCLPLSWSWDARSSIRPSTANVQDAREGVRETWIKSHIAFVSADTYLTVVTTSAKTQHWGWCFWPLAIKYPVPCSSENLSSNIWASLPAAQSCAVSPR